MAFIRLTDLDLKNKPGVIINGNLTLGPSSVLTIEIGGLAKGSGYDWIKVNGTASLAGTLNVNSFGGFVPAVGSSFNFINFTASSGAFATVNLPPSLNFVLASAFDGLTLTLPATSIEIAFLLSLGCAVLVQAVSRIHLQRTRRLRESVS